MSDETNTVQQVESLPSPESDALDFYCSISSENREIEREFVTQALANQVFPQTIRYGIFKNTYRGVIKSIENENYYFQFPPNKIFHIVKADTPTKQWEANKLFKNCSLGCDLIKAKKNINPDDDDKEDEKKSDIGTLPPASQSEAQNVASQDSQITEHHPGAATTQTPQQDGSSERWHGQGHIERSLPPIDHSQNQLAWSTNDLLKAWGQQLQETAPKLNPIDPQERKFMTEVLGKTPNEIDAGRTKLNGIQRAQFNHWLTRSLRGQMDTLSNWLQKGRR